MTLAATQIPLYTALWTFPNEPWPMTSYRNNSLGPLIKKQVNTIDKIKLAAIKNQLLIYLDVTL